VEGLVRALPLFHEQGLYPAANLGINRLTGGPDCVPDPPAPGAPVDALAVYQAFCEAFSRFYRFAADMGFTMANACYPMSEEPERDGLKGHGEGVYGAASAHAMVSFRPEEKAALFRALLDTVPRHRHRLRIFTPRSALLRLARHYEGAGEDTDQGTGAYPCRGGVDFFFVDSRNMDTYPCGYRGGENLGPFQDLDLDALGPARCTRCDWECFRDPCELLGPVMDALRRPLRLGRTLLRDREMARAWLGDLRYYRACGYFDGRTPPDRAALERFRPRP
jgi:hypothetical protein